MHLVVAEIATLTQTLTSLLPPPPTTTHLLPFEDGKKILKIHFFLSFPLKDTERYPPQQLAQNPGNDKEITSKKFEAAVQCMNFFEFYT